MTNKKDSIGLTVGRPSAKIEQETISNMVAKNKEKKHGVRISFDIPENHHLNLKYYAMINKTTIAKLLQEYIAELPQAPLPQA
jgi:hypothetical protein